MTAPSRSWQALRALVGLALVGCVRAYHPMSGLHDPVVVDPSRPNLAGVAVTVRCLPGDYLDPAENGRLCDHVGQLLLNQGATVAVQESPNEDAELLDDDGAAEGDAAQPDLLLVLRSRRPYFRRPTFGNWLFGLGTGTLLVPVWREYTFAVDLTVRNAAGAVLVSDELEGRVVERGGIGAWLVNAIANGLRKPDNRLTPRRFREELSGDFDGQLSQRVFDARLRWQVLGEIRLAEEAP